jgi:hypothetical protein
MSETDLTAPPAPEPPRHRAPGPHPRDIGGRLRAHNPECGICGGGPCDRNQSGKNRLARAGLVLVEPFGALGLSRLDRGMVGR